MHVAIAGYGDLTRYICKEFAKAGHVLVILTRNHKPQLEEQGFTQAVVDYTLSSLICPLADCDVLISAISDISSSYTDTHKTLIQACHKSPKCKRFVTAEFAADIESYPDQPGFYFIPHELIRERLRRQEDIEWTLVCTGWLPDYFVSSKNRYIRDIGTGNEPVDFTWARDVAKGLESLVKALRGLWDPYTFMSGERSCWNDMAIIVQQRYHLVGPVEHRSLHSVAEMIKTAKDEETLILADYHLLSISQACANPVDKVQAHREKFFPDVRFRILQDGLSRLDVDPHSML